MPAVRLVPPAEYPTLGWGVIDWVEKHLCHGPGDVEGDSLLLDDEFCRFIIDAYRIYPAGHPREGERVVSFAELSRPKGRAKSELAGALVCAEFVGPVRFSHWEPDGTPVGKRVRYPFIRCLATEEGQAGNTYDNVRSMLTHGIENHPDEFEGVDVGLTRVFLNRDGGGEIRPSTASAGAKDGGKETFAVADETHLLILPEHRSMVRTVQRNLRKRKAAQPWMMATTTQFEPGQDSVAELNRTAAEDYLKHPQRKPDGFMWDHREGSEVMLWADDAQVLASLKEAYGEASKWMDLARILSDEIRAPGSTEADGRRYWLNQRATSAGKAVDGEKWDSLRSPLRIPSEGAEVVLCFDGSKLDNATGRVPDHTALCGWTVEERPHLFLLGVWEPQVDDQRSVRAEVRLTVAHAFSTYKVRRMVCDPRHWEAQIDDWAEEYGEDVVLKFDTNSPKRMGEAVDRFVKEGVPLSLFTHDGDPVLRRHVLNSVLTRSRRGDHSALAKPKETEKIDACVAAVIGFHELPNIEPAEPALTPVVVFV
jgi:phage terminase large subunit-like protein